MVVLHTLKQLFCKCFITIDYHQIAMGEMEQTPSTTMVLPSTESHGESPNKQMPRKLDTSDSI